MIRFLPIAVLLILLGGSFLYIRNRLQPQEKSTPEVSGSLSLPTPNPSLSDHARIEILEKSMTLIAQEVAKLAPAKSSVVNTTSPATETKLKNLENMIASLQNQINQLKGSSSVPTSAKKNPVYIPLGSGGTSGDRNWINANNYQAVINPSDYSGYTSMQLEVIMNLSEAVGEARARLYNSSDGSVVSSASVSTTSSTASLVSSGGFTLSSGSKTYVLQVQSSEGYTINLQSARIKVNF